MTEVAPNKHLSVRNLWLRMIGTDERFSFWSATLHTRGAHAHSRLGILQILPSIGRVLVAVLRLYSMYVYILHFTVQF